MGVKPSETAERRKKALRDNLKKRKAQLRDLGTREEGVVTPRKTAVARKADKETSSE